MYNRTFTPVHLTPTKCVSELGVQWLDKLLKNVANVRRFVREPADLLHVFRRGTSHLPKPPYLAYGRNATFCRKKKTQGQLPQGHLKCTEDKQRACLEVVASGHMMCKDFVAAPLSSGPFCEWRGRQVRCLSAAMPAPRRFQMSVFASCMRVVCTSLDQASKIHTMSCLR